MELYKIVLVVVLVKLLINLSKHIRCILYLRRYKKYLKDPNWKFESDVLQIKKIFQDAGVPEARVMDVEPIGFGYVQKRNIPLFQNITLRRKDIISLTLSAFHRAIGVYRSRMIDSTHPFYWLEFMLFLPKQALGYLGVSAEKTLVKIVQVIYWMLSSIVSICYLVFGPEILQLIRDKIGEIFQ